jgi:integrase
MSNTTVSLDYTTPTHTPALNTHLTEQVAAAVAASKRANTLRAYRSDLAAFSTWCAGNGLPALPASPDTVAAYLADQVARGLKVTTVRRHLATISKAHTLAGYSHERNPATYELVKATLAGLRQTHGAAPDQAPGLTPDQLDMALTAISTALPAAYGRERRPDLVGLRDRALLVVGWCAALRRSELAQLRWGQITWEAGGVVLLLEGSKTDKQGEGQKVGVAAEPDSVLCPVEALRAWQAACEQRGVWRSGVWQSAVADDQPVFRQVNKHGHLGAALSPHSVGAIISQRCAAVGLVGYTGHSLRRGLIQAATLAGKEDSEIMRTSRHRSVTMLRKYQADAGLLEKAASRGLRGKQH